MTNEERNLAYFLPPAGVEIGLKNDQLAMGDEVRDFVYDRVDDYPEVMRALIAGLFAWAFDVERAGAHERNWPHPITRVEAMRVVIKYIELCIEADPRLGHLI